MKFLEWVAAALLAAVSFSAGGSYELATNWSHAASAAFGAVLGAASVLIAIVLWPRDGSAPRRLARRGLPEPSAHDYTARP